MPYQSSRFTTDVDFSTQQKVQDIHLPTFIDQLRRALEPVDLDNEYGLSLAPQQNKLNPKNSDSIFATLQMKIGYGSSS